MKVIPVPVVFGPSGAASVRLTKTSVAVIFSESGEQYMFPRDVVTLPSFISSGKWFVSVSADGTKIYDVRPLAGTFPMVFTKFKSGQDGVPSPIPVEKHPPEVKYDQHYMKFTALLEVTEGQYKGVNYSYPMRYLNLINQSGFGAQNGTLVVQGNPLKSPHVAKLSQFMELFGGSDLELPYSANVLPELQSALLRIRNTVEGEVAKGWVDQLKSIPVKAKKKVS